jgi:thiosulfate/3-mercaptopyruvate sulfurtransferase
MAGRKETSPDNSIIRWISPEWLEVHLNDAGLVVLDCRQDSHAYFMGHISGSVHFNEALIRMHVGRVPVRWISAEAAQLLFCTLGLGEDRPVVVYTACRQEGVSPQAAAGNGLEAAFVAYSLVRFGCRRVMILDGGLDQWKAEGRPLAQEYGKTSPSAFTVEVPIDLFIGYEECVRIKDHPDVVLLDTRPSAWYEGQGPWRKPGHIPGAVSLPASRLLVPGSTTRLKPEAEIRAILAGPGIMPEKTVICSCGTGRSAATVFLVLKWYLGYPDVVMYEGGFAEWASHPENCTVTGKTPR